MLNIVPRARFLGMGMTLLLSLGLLLPSHSSAQYTKKPSRIVQIVTPIIAALDTAALVQIGPTALNLGAFTIPDGQVFVMTSLLVFPETYSSGSVGIHILQSSATRSFYRVSTSGPTQLQFSVGLVLAPGAALSIRNVYSGDPSIRVTATGYLAPDV